MNEPLRSQESAADPQSGANESFAERERSSAGIALSCIALALVGFYVWVSLPAKPPPAVTGNMLTPHDELLGIESRGGQTWVVGAFGMVLHSSDAGAHWTVQNSGTSQTLASVSFADSQHGFAVGAGGTILATTDGSSWASQNSGTTSQLMSVKALSDTQAFAVGASGTVLGTRDGGAHWATIKPSWKRLIPDLIASDPSLEPNLNAVCFLSRKLGWIVGEFGIILQTADGGETWSCQRYGRTLPQLYAVDFEHDYGGWALGQLGSLLHSSDGGQHWQDIELRMNSREELDAIALEGKNAVIIGSRTVFWTGDGGGRWTSASVPLNVQLAAVLLQGDKALAVGQRGTVLTLNRPGLD